MLVWNWLAFGIFMTLLSQLFFLLASITFCCVILRFTFWKLHSFIIINHYFRKNRFCCHPFALLSLSSIFPLSLPSPLMQTQSLFSPSTASSSCLVILMCWVFFFLLFFCVPSEWITPKVLGNSVPVIREGRKGEV